MTLDVSAHMKINPVICVPPRNLQVEEREDIELTVFERTASVSSIKRDEFVVI